jgi:RNA processing factor Prp31
MPYKSKEDGFSSFEIFLVVLNLIVSRDKEPNFVCNVCPSENISPVDFINVKLFAKKSDSIGRVKQLHSYLVSKTQHVAPNLVVLIGEMVGVHFISHVENLTNLAKYPTSTMQILGIEKLLLKYCL